MINKTTTKNKTLSVPWKLLGDSDEIIETITCEYCNTTRDVIGKTFLSGCPNGCSMVDEVLRKDKKRMEGILNLFKK